MRFLGIDFGWQGKPSGLAALSWDGNALQLVGVERRTGIERILPWVDEQSQGGPAMVAVDAPTIITNQTGSRAAEREVGRRFGKYDASCHSSNLGRAFAPVTVEMGNSLERRGYLHAARIVPRVEGRFQIEVYPHAATIQLFGLQQIVKYKKGRVAERRIELARYRDLLLTNLPKLTPAIADLSLSEIPHTGPAMKEIEDQMDAVLCAYIGAHWWYWGSERNLVYGSREEGYIVVPGPRSVDDVGAR